jgi:hypothetical protein
METADRVKKANLVKKIIEICVVNFKKCKSVVFYA